MTWKAPEDLRDKVGMMTGLLKIKSLLRRFFVENRTVNNASWLIGGKILQMILSFLLGVLTTRFLGPSNYGLINRAGAFVNFFLPICTLGIHSIIVNEIIMSPDRTEEFLGSGIGIRCIASIVSIGMIQVLMFVLEGNNQLLLWVSLLQSAGLLFQSFDLIELWYQSKLEAKYISIVTLAAYILTSVYKIILLVTEKSVSWFAFSHTLDYLLVALMYVILYKFRERRRFVFRWRCVWDLLKKSYQFILSSLMVAVYAQMDKIMLGEMLDDEAVGLYSVGVAICSMWVFVLSAVINSIRPNIIQAKKEGRQDVYHTRIIQMYSIVFWAAILVSVFFCVFAGFIIGVLYGPAYLGAKNAFRIVTWYTGVSYLGVARSTWMVCENKQRYEKILAALGAVSNVILNFALIPLWGICGAAAATLLTQLLTNVIIPFFFKDLRENSVLILKCIVYPVQLIRKNK